jgi:signal transduction histidine kinase
LPADETPREIAFCSHAILESALFEVPNALDDERFFDNPLVTYDPNIRFYAGTQLTTPSGYKIGTLCVINNKPQKLTRKQRSALELLGREVISQLELRKHNKELVISNKYKTEFLSNVSHELRTPLNAIVGLSELVLKLDNLPSLDPKLTSYLNQINYSGNCMLEIINSVLDLGKIEAGKMEIEESACDLTHTIQNTISMLHHQATDKEITIVSQIDPNCKTTILIDKQKLSQVLVNLITNAIKFTDSGKNIYVRLSKHQHELHIEIEDEGKGIESNELELLFNKYAQVGKKKQAQEGTGLGLSITKGLMDLMSGTINLTSQPGVGTKVNLTLPFTLAPQGNVPNTHSIVIPSDIRVLVVEDNKINQNVIGAMLTHLNIEFDLVDTGEEAIIKINEQYDMVLMDINLPGISGIEATMKLKDIQFNKPIIALTADVFCSKTEKALFNSFLTKPIKLDDLKVAIGDVLNNKTL